MTEGKILTVHSLSTNASKGGSEFLMEEISKLTKSMHITYDKVSAIQKKGQQGYYHYAIFDRNKQTLDYVRELAVFNKLKGIIRNSGINDLDKLPVPCINIFQDPYKWLHEFMKENKLYEKVGQDHTSFYEYGHYYTKLQQLSEGKNIAVSEFMKEYIEELGLTCEGVINNSVDPSIFNDDPIQSVNIYNQPIELNKTALKQNFGIPENKKVATWVGPFYPNKWQLMPELIKSNPDVHFILAMKTDIKTRPTWAKNITIIKNTPREQLKQIYLASDFHISTSPVESFSLCGLESLFCNRPIITANTGFMKYTKNKDKYGITVEKFTAEAYNNAIKELNLELKPKNTALEEFSYEYFQNKWKKITEKF